MLAQRLGWAFVDTDVWICGMARKSIPEIFAEEGEPYFRELERQALDEALWRSRTVVATGGGAVVDPANRELMARRSWVILLEAQPQTILRRLQAEQAGSQVPLRPLLAGDDPLQRIIELKRQRQSLYQTLADRTVHTDELTLDEVVEAVLGHLHELGVPVISDQ
jgi:shikimate kinase